MRLNPFLYVSETSILFALVVVAGVIMPAIYISDWFFHVSDLIGSLTMKIGTTLLPSQAGISLTNAGIGILETGASLHDSLFYRTVISICTFTLIPILVYLNYKKAPQQTIRKFQLRIFDPQKMTEHWTRIQELIENDPSARKQSPIVMYQPLDTSTLPYTFGSGKLKYLALPGGLVKLFRTNRKMFDSIVCHEIGHLANNDVSKLSMVEATWRTLRIILPAYVVTLLAAATALAAIVSESLSSMLVALIFAGSYSLYFLVFMVIIFFLRKKMIRTREFYADARAAEWQGSQNNLVEALRSVPDEPKSKYRGLFKLHPSVLERIDLLENNLRLFSTSLWIAFSLGFVFNLIEYTIVPSVWIYLGISALIDTQVDVASRAIIAIFIFTAIMLAVSSSFHKLVLRDKFVNENRFFSKRLLLDAAKYSVFFSLGWVAQNVIELLSQMALNPAENTYYLVASSGAWLFHALYFSFSLVFILLFSAVTLPRYFSFARPKQLFLAATALSSALYITNRYLIAEMFLKTPGDLWLMAVMCLVFLSMPFVFQFAKNKNLQCQICRTKITFRPMFKASCPNCLQPFYSWAVYRSPLENSLTSPIVSQPEYSIPPPPPMFVSEPACPTCGYSLSFIQQYERWYCYNCQKYV
jgi:Zn-dependent protease with chaperone function